MHFELCERSAPPCLSRIRLDLAALPFASTSIIVNRETFQRLDFFSSISPISQYPNINIHPLDAPAHKATQARLLRTFYLNYCVALSHSDRCYRH